MAEPGNTQQQHPRRFVANIPVPSKLDVSSSNLETSWKKFYRQWTNYEIASRLDQEQSNYRCAVLLACIGEDAMELYDGLPFEDGEDKQDIETVLAKFKEFCIGAHEAYEAYVFNKRSQDSVETIDAYIAALRKLAKTCNFGELEDRMIRDRVVVGVKDDTVREKLLEDRKLTLQRCIEICRAYESSRSQAKTMSDDSYHENKVYRLQDRSNKQSQPSSFAKKQYSKPNQYRKPMDNEKTCGRCGRSPHSYDECPAKNVECRKCRRTGHYAAMCRSKTVNTVQSEETCDDVFLGQVNDNSNNDPWKVNICIDNDKKLAFKLDTGADVTVVPSNVVPSSKQTLQKSTKTLYGPGGKELEVLGFFTAKLVTGNQSTIQDLFIVQNLEEPLLGRPAIVALDLIKRINKVDSADSDQIYRDKFPELFTGLGKINSVYKIKLKDNAKAFAVSTPRRLPLPLFTKVKDELHRMEQMGVIRPVTKPAEWCAPIVVVPKANDKVRICVDLTQLNESVCRENFPLPSTDQLLAQLSGATVFSKLDCNSGFYQIPLDDDSQELTTFISPFGRFCFTRLPFGISSGPEVFHRNMTQLLDNIPGVICDIDDILVSGHTQKEHDERLDRVMRKLQDAGVTLNDKCMFSRDKIRFLGQIISADGITIDPQKVTAIENFPRPTNITEIRQIPGLVNHVAKFAPNVAEVTKPLRDLLKKENQWIWSDPQEQAFIAIKKGLSSAPILAHYSMDKNTKVSADASSFGLGAVLLQKDGEHWKPVFYASRSLSATEQRYAQVEKEALAVTWSCEKFSDYLIGLKTFTIETDHKPLLALLKSKHLDELSSQIQRFRMRMMRFSYDIEYTPGKNLVIADTLSRAPVSAPDNTDIVRETETSRFVRAVIECMPASERRLAEIRSKLADDRVCRKVMDFCRDGWSTLAKVDPDIRSFWSVRSELTVQEGLLLYNNRLVIPEALRQDILTHLHEGHQGIVKCRALAKSSVWWPGLSSQLQTLVENCMICERNRKQGPEPLNPSKIPDYPWQKVGMDLFEWNGGQYLLVVDYFSRYIELAYLSTTSSNTVIEHLKSIFARQGIPEIVVSDNGPQFSSHQFAQFAVVYGFNHVTSSPYYPQGNGEAERAVQTVKNLLKKAIDPYIAMLNYRATPLQNGYSPAQLLMGRKLRTKIPVMPSELQPKSFSMRSVKTLDSVQKDKQKRNFNQIHKAKSLSILTPGQQVWVKKPYETEGVVVRQAGERSYIIKTRTGFHRRNRSQLACRNSDIVHRCETPTRMSTLLPRSTSQHSNSPLTFIANDDINDDMPNVNINPGDNPMQVTRSGRVVRKPNKLNL